MRQDWCTYLLQTQPIKTVSQCGREKKKRCSLFLNDLTKPESSNKDDVTSCWGSSQGATSSSPWVWRGRRVTGDQSQDEWAQ